MCERDLGLSSILGRAAVAPTSLQGAVWVGLPPSKPPPESHRRLLGLPDGISSLLPFAVGPPARSQQLPAEPGSPESLCAPRSIPTACPREGRNRPPPRFSGSGEHVCSCLCGCATEDAVSCLWGWSMRGREASVTRGEDDVSLLRWALLCNFSTE